MVCEGPSTEEMCPCPPEGPCELMVHTSRLDSIKDYYLADGNVLKLNADSEYSNIMFLR